MRELLIVLNEFPVLFNVVVLSVVALSGIFFVLVLKSMIADVFQAALRRPTD